MCVEEVAHGRRDHPAHGGRERHHPQVTRHRPGLQVQPGLDLLEVGEQPGAGVDEVSAVAGQHHAAADPLQQRHPGLALQSFHLLRDRARREAEHVGGRDHGPVVGHGPEGGQRGEINHERMLHRQGYDNSLDLHGFGPEDGVMSLRDSLLAALVATIWGFNFVVIDWGMDGVPPLVLSGRPVRSGDAAGALPGATTERPVAHGGRGRGIHVAGPVRVPLRRHGRRPPARPGRAGAAGPGDLHDRDRRRRAAGAADPGAGVGRGRGLGGSRGGRLRARGRRPRHGARTVRSRRAVVGDRQRHLPLGGCGRRPVPGGLVRHGGSARLSPPSSCRGSA